MNCPYMCLKRYIPHKTSILRTISLNELNKQIKIKAKTRKLYALNYVTKRLGLFKLLAYFKAIPTVCTYVH